MLEISQVAELHVDAPLQPGRPSYVATASGVVQRGERLYVVADDEPAVAVFDSEGARGQLLPLDREPLPLEHAKRKAQKPDLESLALLSPGGRWPDGTLLTLGSGSTTRRERGWLWPFEAQALSREPVELSLSPLYERLRAELPDLNIEGAAAAAGRLWLAQRGNGADGFNALVELSLDDVIASLAADATIPPDAVVGIHRMDLGSVEGVELTFSDLAPIGDAELAFCAIAEAVDSTYLDGPCVGAAVGVLDPARREVALLERLPGPPHKIEGVTVRAVTTSELEVLLVADADVTDHPAPLLKARVSRRRRGW